MGHLCSSPVKHRETHITDTNENITDKTKQAETNEKDTHIGRLLQKVKRARTGNAAGEAIGSYTVRKQSGKK